MTWFNDKLERYLREARQRDSLRTLKPSRPEGGVVLSRDGRRMIDFSSNNYLGLARHPALTERANQWTSKWGAGSGASRLVTGTYEIHQAVEDKLARLKGAEAALLFNSGYQANSTILPALMDSAMTGSKAIVFTDKLVHASIHHGCKSAGIRQIRFRHNDIGHLESLLEKSADKPGARFIVTESVFSMDGDTADLKALAALGKRFNAFLYVDEAHGTGVLGPDGMGLSGALKGEIDLVMGTFSKALGCFGAYVTCSRIMKQYLINSCPGFIYSTALPPGVLGAMDAALDMVPGMNAERQRLHANADKLRAALKAAGIDSGASSTQIVPAFIGSAKNALKAAEILANEGLLAMAIRPPTVPKGASRIRFAVSSEHSDDDMARLIAVIPRIGELSCE